jgi:hypothetical protein
MKVVIGLMLAASAFGQASRAAYSSSLDEVFPHVADGGGWKSTITIVNMDTVEAPYELQFLNSRDQPLMMALRGASRVATNYTGTLPVNGSITVETLGEARDVVTGWARVETRQHVGGTLVFSKDNGPGLAVSEAAIPMTNYAERTFRLPFDNTGGFVTSMALAHGQTFSPETVVVIFYDEQGNRLHLDEFTLQPRNQVAFTLPDRWPQIAGRRGVAVFRGRSYLSAFGLRFHPSGSFTVVNSLASSF